MKNTIETPRILPVRNLFRGDLDNRPKISHFAGIVGASQIPDAIVFTDGSLVQATAFPFAHFATEEEYRPQTIPLTDSVAVVYPNRALFVLAPLNQSSQGIEAITLKNGHMSYSVTDVINAQEAVRQAQRDAYEFKLRQKWIELPLEK